MKKVSLYVLLACMPLFVACKKTPEKDLVGLWKLEKSTYTATDNSNVIENSPAFEVRYKKDGTGTSTFTVSGTTTPFEWYLSEDYTRITHTTKSGSSQSYRINTFTEDQFIIDNEVSLDTTGTVYVYRAAYAKIGK